MRSRLIAGVKRVFNLHHPGPNLEIFPDDVFLVSYPKSGNTWTRFLVANLMYPTQNPDFGNIDRLIPAPEVMTKRDFNRMPRPRIIRTHSPFDPRFQQVIYIVRDPRDVAVSQFHHHHKRKLVEDGHPIEAFVNRFIAGETNQHGSWKQNVGSWLAARYGDSRFLLLRYEDMIEDTAGALRKIASFLGVAADAQTIEEAVQRSSAGRMRKLEQTTGEGCALIKGTRQDLPFVRSAKSGNWKSDLPSHCVEAIEQHWGAWMQWLGYSLSTAPASVAKPDLASRAGVEVLLGRPNR